MIIEVLIIVLVPLLTLYLVIGFCFSYIKVPDDCGCSSTSAPITYSENWIPYTGYTGNNGPTNVGVTGERFMPSEDQMREIFSSPTYTMSNWAGRMGPGNDVIGTT